VGETIVGYYFLVKTLENWRNVESFGYI
jgi:hypothetical protein